MRTTLLTIVISASLAVAMVYAQRINSADEYQQAMKTVDGAMKAVAKTVGAGDYPGAKVPLVLARQTLAASAPFWSRAKVDAAVKLTKDAVQKLDDLDAALSAPSVDVVSIKKTLSQVSDACANCHAEYRDGDNKSGYRIKQRS